MRYGFVGTGELTAAIVTGLCDGVADPPEVFLSPRGRAVGAELAARFPSVAVCADNTEVVARADVLTVAVRPPLARDVLSGLTFRPEQVVISALAGVPLERLGELAPTARALVRAIPLPQAAQRQSLTALHPDQPAARALFERVGDVIIADTESALDAMSTATATFAAHLDQLATIAGWLTEHGLAAEQSAGYLKYLYGAVGRTLQDSTDTFETLTTRHMTPGGINEQVLADLRRAGQPEAMRRALDRVLIRLRGPAE
ncbi:NAD(P)-binding domain-containing protein [Microlunatus parietis]|uniref:Pyrroline-5-carboxylate reductase n=1 Tax=Microlunatus parietis TaxID=682979 RepID=A0A7Y9I564_9ACTN|nr:NAD(P)-binding domain-containing protein [Microlunatus parietis]NYE70490.1 pyrroline-5-carboxylate reductase [Microlunatus parietis]